MHTLDDTPEATRDTLTTLQRRMGTLLNIHAETAHSPVVPTGDTRLDTLLTVVRQAAAGGGYVDDASWNDAQAAGWSDEQRSEAFAHRQLNQFTHYLGIELDVPAAPDPRA